MEEHTKKNYKHLYLKNFSLKELKNKISFISSENEVSQKQSSTNNKRIAKYDNLKGLAIILVLFIHVISPARENNVDFYVTFANFLCVFAMPIFFFVGGYFSKVSENSNVKAFKNIFIPYIIFSAIWMVYNYFILGKSFHPYPFIVPVYALWFLASLFTMKLILPILVKIKYILPIAIIASLLIGILPISDDYFSYTRTFGFLPVFLVGYYYNDYKKTFIEKISKYRRIVNLFKSKTFFYFLVILFIILVWVFCEKISLIESSYDILQLNSHYKEMDLSWTIGIFSRFMVIVSGIMGALLVNKLMTNKVTFLTRFGINAFAIYILHLYIVRFIFVKLRQDSPMEFIFNDILLNTVYTIIMVSLISYILSRDFMAKLFTKFVNFFQKVIMHP